MLAPSNSRPSAVAGTFYPAEPGPLRAEVERYVRAAPAPAFRPKALVVPHAGYIYSGPTAGAAYAAIAAARPPYRRVVLIGPAHRVPVRGLAVPGVASFTTPLGTVALDRESIDRLRADPAVTVSDFAHAAEHSLEVQLPFLQVTLGDFTLVPMVAGLAASETVARVLALLWGADETLLVISSDLSHYHPAAEAERRDTRTSERILALDGSLRGEDACGCVGLNGFLLLASQRGLVPRLMDLRHSGDTAGDRRQVVGYGSYAFHAAAA
jgi:AmmeMemoRadiSam system protein B